MLIPGSVLIGLGWEGPPGMLIPGSVLIGLGMGGSSGLAHPRFCPDSLAK